MFLIRSFFSYIKNSNILLHLHLLRIKVQTSLLAQTCLEHSIFISLGQIFKLISRVEYIFRSTCYEDEFKLTWTFANWQKTKNSFILRLSSSKLSYIAYVGIFECVMVGGRSGMWKKGSSEAKKNVNILKIN